MFMIYEDLSGIWARVETREEAERWIAQSDEDREFKIREHSTLEEVCGKGP